MVIFFCRLIVLHVDQHDEDDEEEGLYLREACHHKVTGDRLTNIKLNNGNFVRFKIYSSENARV